MNPEKFSENFLELSRMMRVARAHANLSQREVGEKAGLSPSCVSRFEQGKVMPTIENMFSMIWACGFFVSIKLVKPGEPPPE